MCVSLLLLFLNDVVSSHLEERAGGRIYILSGDLFQYGKRFVWILKRCTMPDLQCPENERDAHETERLEPEEDRGNEDLAAKLAKTGLLNKDTIE